MRYLVLALLLLPHSLWAAPRQIDAYRWENVGRIVAIGDLHGDYRSYLAVLQAAGVVDQGGRWIAGDTHLVQTGDIADRGPDTHRIIAHMAKLAQEAQRRGGRVHNLLGNHEAMNVYGDLRYVDPGEYAAFAGKGSAALRDRYFDALMARLRRDDPQRYAALPADYRARWEREHPLGWVEHRSAWDPRWNAKGELFRWAMRAKVAIQLNDIIFLHGGISSDYCGNGLDSLTTMARAALRSSAPDAPDVLRDPRGPLWYRGLAGVAPATRQDTVDAILQRHGARRIVVGHTPTGGAIWPRLDGRVVLIDTGMAAVYGSHIAWLEATAGGLFAGYRAGRVRLPPDDAGRLAYLERVIALEPGNAALVRRRDGLRAGQPDVIPALAGADAAEATGPAAGGEPTPICGIAR